MVCPATVSREAGGQARRAPGPGGDQIEQFVEDGTLTSLHLAISQKGEEGRWYGGCYVQGRAPPRRPWGPGAAHRTRPGFFLSQQTSPRGVRGPKAQVWVSARSPSNFEKCSQVAQFWGVPLEVPRWERGGDPRSLKKKPPGKPGETQGNGPARETVTVPGSR